MNKSKIEWCDKTWNPITGCTPISEGCQNCYAKRTAEGRLKGRCGYSENNPFQITKHPNRLYEPIHSRNSHKIFVCSMGDLFHKDVPDHYIDEVIGVMLACKIFSNMPEHQFMILTKRPERAKEYFSETPKELLIRWANAPYIHPDDPDHTFEDCVYSEVCHDWDENGTNSSGGEYKPWGYIERIWPLDNIWIGISTENQERADKRIPELLETPAAKRFISIEPLLGPVGIQGNIDWVIVGAETGPNARRFKREWVQKIIDQCRTAGVPVFLKDNLGWPVKIQEWPEC